jgi:DNA-binding CsgD family transcriptional regulator
VARVRVAGDALHDRDVRAAAEAAANAGSPAAALALLVSAADDLEREDRSEAALLLAEASWYARFAQGPARALEVARRAASLAAGAEGGTLLIAQARLGNALQWNGEYAAAQLEWSRASAAVVTTPRDPRLLCALADTRLRSGELRSARETAYAAAARARQSGDPAALRDAVTFQALAEIHLGLLREAFASAREVEVLAGALPSEDRVNALGLLAWVEALLGEEASCRARIAAAGALAAELGFTIEGGLAAGLLALALGEYEEAVRQLETRLGGSPACAAMLALRPFLDSLVEACVRSGQRARAAELLAEVWQQSLATGQDRYLAIAFRMQALAGDDLGDFETALRHHAHWPNRFEEGRTRLLYGEALRRLKRRREAREQLTAARTAFDAVGARIWEQRARDEQRAAGTKLPRPASGIPLTPQEERIARLVAEGLSNKEIAARLVVSTKTVEGHLRNIFEKVGATSRTQVARAVSRAPSR